MPTDTVSFEDDYRELYEHAPCGYLLMLEDGLIVNANQTFLLWTGYTREDLIGKRRFQDLLSTPSKIYYETHVALLLSMQGVVREMAFDLQRPQGPSLSVLVTSVLRQSAKGQTRQYRTTVFDATARRHHERQLFQQKRALEQLNDEKNELLGMAAHELRTPLGIISSYSEFLEDEAGPNLSEEHREFLSLIRNTSKQMLGLINDILDISRIEAGKLHLDRQQTDLSLLVEQTVAINQRLADKKNIHIRFKQDNNLPLLWIDAKKIAQVLNNLQINAIKFSPPETVIIISLQHDDAYVWIKVADQGQGIPAEDLKTIFEPFRQGQTQSTHGEPSTGLGLAIVRRIVEGHEGCVTVSSSLGQGTEFSIQLPLGNN